jgi:hypothetical protein
MLNLVTSTTTAGVLAFLSYTFTIGSFSDNGLSVQTTETFANNEIMEVAGSGGFLRINGAGYNNVKSVSVAGNTMSFTVVSDTKLNLIMPELTTGTHAVSIATSKETKTATVKVSGCDKCRVYDGCFF